MAPGCFEIDARAGAARAGVLATGHGEVRTPVFVPLASTGTVKTAQASEVEALGFEMVLGNTFHLFMQPGEDYVAAMGGLHEFMGWRRAIVTDSGGYQVFSMGHGSVADEIKGRRTDRRNMVLSIGEDGVRFRSYLDGSERLMRPETAMAVQAALGSDVALAFDECTPAHAGRDYTARALERTHRWLARCVEWHERHGSERLLFGIVQGGTYDDLRDESAGTVATAAVDGVAIGGSLGQEKAQMRHVVERSLRALPEHLPRHLLGIGDVDDILAAVAAGVDMLDCATPTRLGRHGTALVPEPDHRWRLDLKRAASSRSREPIVEGCRCPACREHTRGYLHYLLRAGELTGMRLVTLHNLSFMAQLMRGIRESVSAGHFERYAELVLAGVEPYGSATASGPPRSP